MKVNSTTKKTCSIGEELFLVHLRRASHMHDDSDDDDDIERIFPERHHRKKRSKSIGEELFEVHLKRSVGCEPDIDCEKNHTKKEVEHNESNVVCDVSSSDDKMGAIENEQKVVHEKD
mmetsp:Transcript_33592/g.49364  ORF Transcript_33592/g.49364 Transcript_33592/m.49364 type:complete len:118 (-) Transcript_33592:252-605(-)|eukprot:CAMPEP_0195530172 /NCGR_PEP_ID=MMETSP0794_2-20130614/32973_1 /TAXON_ID=515487 /ORGANISM="Stephanopyxis turris, Strain CCMP 815" /LENGTH=117 /DNA_ID=CAMNT_0040661619 /DNA_START=74 /DNA_END=427 /DNA_ORIENTATION=+